MRANASPEVARSPLIKRIRTIVRFCLNCLYGKGLPVSYNHHTQRPCRGTWLLSLQFNTVTTYPNA